MLSKASYRLVSDRFVPFRSSFFFIAVVSVPMTWVFLTSFFAFKSGADFIAILCGHWVLISLLRIFSYVVSGG